jgi:hypothetical protein
MDGQGGVARLLSRRPGTGEGKEMESAAAFDGGDGALVVDGGSGDVL